MNAGTRGTLTVAAGGDLIGPSRPVAALRDPAIEAVLDIFRRADVGYANHEGSTFDLERFDGAPAAVNGGGYPLSSPVSLIDLRSAGINLVSKANNHALDWGKRGLRATLDALDCAGIAHAGTGRNRAAAQRPGYLETPNGRVALVSLASTFVPLARAGEAGGPYAGRPGLFAYRVTPVNLVRPDDLEVIRRIAGPQGIETGDLDGRSHLVGDDIVLGEERFRAGMRPGLVYEPHPRDHADALAAVRFASQTADLVIVAVHSHESITGAGSDRRAPAFLVDLYHDCIEAGADMAVTTGSHVVRGVEIYDGKPLFHGLASLFLELGTGYGEDPDALRAAGQITGARTPSDFVRATIPAPDEWYDGIVTKTTFVDGALAACRVHPLRLTTANDGRLAGQPRLATSEDAARVLEEFRKNCAELGTTVEIADTRADLVL